MSQEVVLERFHRALIEEIQTQRPEYLTGPFTVAEIYQNLVPYGSHRDRIGVEMNADYEDALLRLLAGEGGFLVLESVAALRDIQAELETSNPNTGLYREFAAVDVRLNQSRLDLSTDGVDELADLVEELEAEPTVSMNELAPVDAGPKDMNIVPPGVDIFEATNGPPPRSDPAVGDDSEPAVELDMWSGEMPSSGLQPEFVEPEPEPAPEPEPEAASAVHGGEPCRWCRAELPDRDKLNFCPYCGTDLNLVPCPSCGEELESEWRFCVACGTGVDA